MSIFKFFSEDYYYYNPSIHPIFFSFDHLTDIQVKKPKVRYNDENIKFVNFFWLGNENMSYYIIFMKYALIIICFPNMPFNG